MSTVTICDFCEKAKIPELLTIHRPSPYNCSVMQAHYFSFRPEGDKKDMCWDCLYEELKKEREEK